MYVLDDAIILSGRFVCGSHTGAMLSARRLRSEKYKKQPVENLEGSVWCHIRTCGSWGSGKEREGHFPGTWQPLLCPEGLRTLRTGAAQRLRLKGAQLHDPTSIAPWSFTWCWEGDLGISTSLLGCPSKEARGS